jgi:hypothetical protein
LWTAEDRGYARSSSARLRRTNGEIETWETGTPDSPLDLLADRLRAAADTAGLPEEAVMVDLPAAGLPAAADMAGLPAVDRPDTVDRPADLRPVDTVDRLPAAHLLATVDRPDTADRPARRPACMRLRSSAAWAPAATCPRP